MVADSITLNSMSGGSIVDTEVPTFRGNHLQRIKIAIGPVDSDWGDVSQTNPLPVLITNTTVSGVTASGVQHVFIDNIPTYQGTRLYDANGNLVGIAANPFATNLYAQGVALLQSGGNLLVNVQNFGVGQFSAQDGNANNTTSALVMSQPEVMNTAGTWDRLRGDSTNGAYVQMPKGTTVSGTVNITTPTGLSDKQSTVNSFTMTLASLASVGAPPGTAGRQSTLVDNTSNLYIGAKVYLKIKAGTTPTANTLLYVYLIQYDNSAVADDGAGTSDAAFTPINATPLGTILCNSTSTGNTYTGIFDTTKVVDSLGPKWGIAVVNSWGSALDATEGNHTKNWIGIKRQLS